MLGVNRSYLAAHPEDSLQPDQAAALDKYLIRLEHGEPLPYVLGEWEFFGLKFRVSPGVLIPRPETELLVETALHWLKSQPGGLLGVDVGTGSACIAIALALHCPNLRLLASDISGEALLVGRQNVTRFGLETRIGLVQADLIPPGVRRYDLICANPPYIPRQELQELKVARWEPSLALDGGLNGLEVVGRLLEVASKRLNPGGLFLCEIESRQGQAVLSASRIGFPNADIHLLGDLAGKDRLLVVRT